MLSRVGVVAVQGDYERHILALRAAADGPLEVVEARVPEHLDGLDGVILPGGESTTVGLLLRRYGLGEALVEFAASGRPMWGTCMGMILMAKDIERGRPDQYRLGVLDVTVRRNAFGAQVHSFEDEVPVRGLSEPVLGVFIRAPVVVRYGPGVEVLSEYEGQIVAVRQGNRIGTSFHPELTHDARFHRLFLGL
ncbi:MAG: pyridoxal 5'-phosphate synthase glutaminase subunit PdxT [Fimbriimonadaceae bacterium]|nr:pyridoxal 5'-phosphate synthase glutaminase subunit PdxT [Fimbriimonadaceae bacterium]